MKQIAVLLTLALAAILCACSRSASSSSGDSGGARAETTDIVMDEIPLNCAISNLAQKAHLNYILDPRASSASIGPAKWMMPQRSVTCRGTNMAPELALKQLLREHSLRMVTNAATPVIRIVPLAQVTEPIPASEVGNETNSVIPVVLLGYVPLRVVIDELGKKAGLEISVNPELPIPTSGPPELTIGTSIVSVYWENIRPGQALFVQVSSKCQSSLFKQLRLCGPRCPLVAVADVETFGKNAAEPLHAGNKVRLWRLQN